MGPYPVQVADWCAVALVFVTFSYTQRVPCLDVTFFPGKPDRKGTWFCSLTCNDERLHRFSAKKCFWMPSCAGGFFSEFARE